MGARVVGGGGGGGGGGEAALKPLIDALNKNSDAISSQSDKQGEAKLAKMMEDLSAALELMVSFITRLNDSIAGLKLGFSTLSGALIASAKAQASQKPVKPLTAKQQTQANKDQAKADAKVLAQDKNLSYKREKDDKAILARQLAQDARIAASIIKAQLKADKPKKSDKPPEIMGPFPYEEQSAKNKQLADQQAKNIEDYEAFIKKNNKEIDALNKKQAKAKIKAAADAVAKVEELEKQTDARLEEIYASAEKANKKESDRKTTYDKKLASEQQERDDSRKADTYLALEDRRKKAQEKQRAEEEQAPIDAAKAKAAEEKGASNSVLGVDLGAIGYKMEEFGKAAAVAGAAMTAAGIPVGPMFTAVATASKYMGTTLRWTATIAKGLISAFSWLRSTVSALAKSVAVYAPAISQMAEMALRDMSAVMGAAGVGILKAFIPIIRSISDRMFPVSKEISNTGEDVVKSFAPLIDGIMAILMPTITALIQVFQGLWYVVGPIVQIIGVLVQALGLMWGVVMSLTSIFLDWVMPVFKVFADAVGSIVAYFEKALKMVQDDFAWLLGKRGEDALAPASTVGLAAAQSAKMSSFQSLGESAAQSAFLTSTGGKDPQADLAQDMLNKDLPNKWAIFLDAQGRPQPIVAAQRDNGPAPNNGGGGGDWGPNAGGAGAIKPQWEGFG